MSSHILPSLQHCLKQTENSLPKQEIVFNLLDLAQISQCSSLVHPVYGTTSPTSCFMRLFVTVSGLMWSSIAELWISLGEQPQHQRLRGILGRLVSSFVFFGISSCDTPSSVRCIQISDAKSFGNQGINCYPRQ